MKFLRIPVALLGAVILALGCAGPALGQIPSQAAPKAAPFPQLSFSPIVKKVAPSVVNIYTRRVVRAQAPMFDDPFFRQFFGDQMGVPRERVQRSLGSGVVLRRDGVVVTNNHVIKDSDQITVVLADRREFEATVLGTDDRTDLAILKIDVGSENLPVANLGESDDLEVGDLVLAIGDPFGVGQTVTMGIVSALARTAIGVSDYRFFIQTDAAVNPGNSGGALVDMKGDLIGINTAIFSRSGGSVGIGFAIPSDMVKVVMESITSGGKTVRPWLGVDGQAVTSDLFSQFKLRRPGGVLLNAVQPESPAALAGLMKNDVITAINGRDVDNPEALRFRVAIQPVQGTVQLTYFRDGSEKTVPVRLRAPPEIPARRETRIDGRSPFAGAVVVNINPAVADEMGMPSSSRGVTVQSVVGGTSAARVQFKPGDVIVRVNGKSISSVDELLAETQRPDTAAWQITLRRAGQILSVTLGG